MPPVAVFLGLLPLCLGYPQDSRTFQAKNIQLGGRIVGGNETTILQYPYMVSVRESLVEGLGFHLCGGSIISDRWVVTAAHCCTAYGTDGLAIRVGNTTSDDGLLYQLSQVILHPDYYLSHRVPYNDICLLETTQSITYSDYVKAISLPDSEEEILGGTMAVVSGWGSLEYGGLSVETLREVSVPFVSRDECVRDYGQNESGENYINSTMICAGFTQGGKDACQGDSGGPLAVSGTLVGIVSWGSGCAEPNYPGVYTNVAHYRDWIKSTAGI